MFEECFCDSYTRIDVRTQESGKAKNVLKAFTCKIWYTLKYDHYNRTNLVQFSTIGHWFGAIEQIIIEPILIYAWWLVIIKDLKIKFENFIEKVIFSDTPWIFTWITVRKSSCSCFPCFSHVKSNYIWILLIIKRAN